MDAEIIQFSQFAVAAKQTKEGGGLARFRATKREKQAAALAMAPEKLTTTCRNKYLRDARRKVWLELEAAMEYWDACLKMESAISRVQNHGLHEGTLHPKFDPGERYTILAIFREAKSKLLLAPAPDQRAVAWKQSVFESPGFKYIGVEARTVERAIADDVAFLDAHPTRKSIAASRQAKKSEAMAHRRKFKEGMRRRIRDIAASRDLSDEDIKGAMTCKHHEIAKFTEKHGVNVEWLLEGRGRIFKKDPITLNPNMTGSEFAMVVTTLPMADQQMISTMIREILRERPDETPPTVA